jgi:hypothetical protein
MGAGAEEIVHCHPAGKGHFGVELEGGRIRHDEDEGANSYRGEDRDARNHIIQASHQVLAEKLDSNLFPSLANGGGQEILVARFAASSRKSHMAGPGISDPFGPADEEDGFGIRGQDYRDRGPDQLGILVDRGVAAGQALT